jgi:hypothetical protein
MAVSLSINGNITVSDSTSGIIALQKLLSGLTTTGTVFSEAQFLSIGTSPVAIALPISPIQFLYVKNLHATNTVTVTWTPTSGASATIQTLEPGSAILFCQNVVGAGITALTVVASGTNTQIEYIIGG